MEFGDSSAQGKVVDAWSVHAVNGNSECDDGTICENNSQCIPHPIKEGKYICDCLAVNNVAKAKGGSGVAPDQFAGIYCEHRATTYCTKANRASAHAFCTNGGTCKLSVGKNEKHAGCKCLAGYEGEFCQFTEGSVPSDWTLDNYMHPALISAYGNDGGMNMSQTAGIIAGTVTGFVAIVMCLFGFIFCGRLGLKPVGLKVKRSEKGSDATFKGASNGGASDFVGGKSVYRKKSTTGSFGVTAENLDADGGVLKSALGDVDGQNGGVSQSPSNDGMEDLDINGNVSMEEVDLDAAQDLPGGSLNAAQGEMA